MTDFSILLFEEFETLDAFGPVEVLGRMPDTYRLKYCTLQGGAVSSSQGVKIETVPLDPENSGGCLLIPGGLGTRNLVQKGEFLNVLKKSALKSDFVLTVCTGSALLAATGLLDGRRATSNKRAFRWVQSVNPLVNWQPKARWTSDGKYYTSSGISAGIDMTLGFLSDLHGEQIAKRVAQEIEYIWNEDRDKDPFSLSNE